MLDRAVEMVSEIDESEEDNHVRANVRKELAELLAEGVPEDEARAKAMSRIFSSAPGQYGTGVNVLTRTSKWEERKEIGDYYIGVGSYRYGIRHNGICDEDTLRRRMARIEVTVKNSTSREYDMIDNDDVFQYLGGFNAAVEAVTGKRPMSVIGCSADTAKPVLRTIEEESRFIFHSKVMNPKYEQGLRVHGFRGATEIKHMFEYVFAWDATSNIIEDWMYDTLAERYLLKEDVREWMEKANPYAVHDMLDILMEAESRGMWKPSGDILDRLKDLYLENEELLEEITDRG
jgi:cobaltochelatase CobN